MAKPVFPGWIKGQSIGRGGQAQVYQATKDPDDGQKYALKVLNRDDKSTQAYERFCVEIEALKKLNHPNIVKIVDASSPDSSGPFYYVMEYVEKADTLKKLMQEDRNPFKHQELKSVRLFQQLVDAIRACETARIVHRDLSPGNVLVLPKGKIKIIDFGCCHMNGGHGVTVPGENVGTPNYRAPECEAGGNGPILSCADLYSAGKILWAALVGIPAWARERPFFESGSMRVIFNQNPIYWHIQRIIEKTIRHKVSDRWPEARTASFQTRHIINLIKGKEIPLEYLAHICSFCKTGTLKESDRPKLLNHPTATAGTEMWRPGPHYPNEPQQIIKPDEGVVELVCDYCGIMSFIDMRVWRGNTDKLTKYES